MAIGYIIYNVAETWSAIPGWAGQYEASDLGRVQSVPHTVRTVQGHAFTVKGRLRAPWLDRKGYCHVTLYRGDIAKRHSVHALVMAAFVGPPPPGTEICHNNGDPADNRLANLRYDTRSANHRDKRQHGTARAGEANPRARLTADDVRAIRALYADGRMNQSQLAATYATPQSNVSSIVLRRTWRHVA